MSKQDRQGARTPADLERKYNFGKSFAEAMGIATDAREDAKNAQAAAAEALATANALDADLDQDEIFNRLTNGGEEQGFYLQDGKIYVNASYIKSGVLSGDMIDGSTLTIKKGATIAGWDIDSNSIYKGTDFGTATFVCTGSNNAYSIGGSSVISGWVFGAGGKFGVTKSGVLYASDANISGTVVTTNLSCFSGESGTAPLFYVSSTRAFGQLGGWDFYSGGLTRTYADTILGDVTVTISPEEIKVTHSGQTFTKKWIDLVT
jgi:hypothetical protein